MIETSAQPDFFDESAMRYSNSSKSSLAGIPIDCSTTPMCLLFITRASNFAYRDNCRYSVEGVVMQSA